MAVLSFFVVLWILWKLLGTTVKYAVPFLIFAWIIIFFIKFWWLLLILGIGYFFYYIGLREESKNKTKSSTKNKIDSVSEPLQDQSTHLNETKSTPKIKKSIRSINTEIEVGSIKPSDSNETTLEVKKPIIHKQGIDGNTDLNDIVDSGIYTIFSNVEDIPKNEEEKAVVNTNNEEKLREARETLKKYDNNYESKKEIAPGIVSSLSAIPSKNTINVKTPIIHKLRRKLYNFVIFDIETTGLNKFENDIIQISAVKYTNDEEVARFNTYVKPKILPIPENIQYLTGISTQKVIDAPNIDVAINDFSNFVGSSTLIGHNIVKFDIPFLIEKGFYENDIYVVDTLTLSKNKIFEIKNYKLPTLKKYFGISNRSHNALNDCFTTAKVYQNLRDGNVEKVEPDYSNISQCLKGIRFCITGQFMDMGRDEIEELIESHGGKCTKSVSKLTNYLIDGTQVAYKLTDGIHSSSEIKANELIDNGSSLKIIGLKELDSMIGDK